MGCVSGGGDSVCVCESDHRGNACNETKQLELRGSSHRGRVQYMILDAVCWAGCWDVQPAGFLVESLMLITSPHGKTQRRATRSMRGENGNKGEKRRLRSWGEYGYRRRGKRSLSRNGPSFTHTRRECIGRRMTRRDRKSCCPAVASRTPPQRAACTTPLAPPKLTASHPHLGAS